MRGTARVSQVAVDSPGNVHVLRRGEPPVLVFHPDGAFVRSYGQSEIFDSHGISIDGWDRLMLTFNSPFFPEVLITSNVLAEGVDLHRFCRYVIHHDLCWNPSTLEQRTGRVDRIGAKVERRVDSHLPALHR